MGAAGAGEAAYGLPVLQVALLGQAEESMSERAETGPMQFGDDWCGVFIRGDNAAGFAIALEQLLNEDTALTHLWLARAQLKGLLRLLKGSDQRTVSRPQVMRAFAAAKDAGCTCGSDNPLSPRYDTAHLKSYPAG